MVPLFIICYMSLYVQQIFYVHIYVVSQWHTPTSSVSLLKFNISSNNFFQSLLDLSFKVFVKIILSSWFFSGINNSMKYKGFSCSFFLLMYHFAKSMIQLLTSVYSSMLIGIPNITSHIVKEISISKVVSIQVCIDF